MDKISLLEQKYTKYKNKYLNMKHNKITHYGGSYPLYTEFTRMECREMSTNVLSSLLNDAVKTNRYQRVYYKNNNKIEDGIDSSSGPPGFNMKNFDKKGINIDQYESTYIINYLYDINNVLKKHNVETIQSGISYYVDIPNFSNAYFQNPFIEFKGYTTSSIKVDIS